MSFDSVIWDPHLCRETTFVLFLREGSGSGDTALLGSHPFTTDDGKDVVFRVTRGDYSPLMKLLVENLGSAKVRCFALQPNPVMNHSTLN